MHRIDSHGATQDNRFTEGDPLVPVAPTDVSADWLNAVQDEISTVVEAAGITLDKGQNDQLLKAIRFIAGLYAGRTMALHVSTERHLVLTLFGEGERVSAARYQAVFTALGGASFEVLANRLYMTTPS